MSDKLKKILEKPFVLVTYSTIFAIFNAWIAFFLVRQEMFDSNSLWFGVSVVLSAFFMMFVLPWIIISKIFHRKIYEFGLRKPEKPKEALKLSFIIILLSLPAIFLFANKTSFQNYYQIKENLDVFFLIPVLGSILYYFSEEFLFRGFLIFGLWDKLKFHSFWVSSFIFAFLHITKPVGEVPFAFLLGLALSYLSYKTKSFIPAVVVHIVLMVILNTIVYFFY